MKKNKLWCFWADQKTMSPSRKNALHILENSCDVDLILVTNQNYKKYESPEFPIHPAYEFLSDTHKADYMRFYLCHTLGGGYADIKPFTFSWKCYYELINQDTDLVGSPELHPTHVAFPEYQQHYRDLISVHHFVMKQNSVISNSIMDEIHDILDTNLSMLKKNPGHYHPRAVNKTIDKSGVFQPDHDSYIGVTDYPLKWNEICGAVFHKVQYEHKQRINKAMSSEYNLYAPSQYR